jgi:hypothetical protein
MSNPAPLLAQALNWLVFEQKRNGFLISKSGKRPGLLTPSVKKYGLGPAVLRKNAPVEP